MKQIAAAFVQAQKGFAPALKTSTNPHFKSKYVALGGCIEAVIDALNSNGIALLQPTHDCESGVTVETLFVHESGETMSGGKLHVPAAKNDPQGYGSALTYARRYSLMAACGIAPEDDDGNAASERGAEGGGNDPLLMFTRHEQAVIRKAAQSAIVSFNEGQEYSAYEEVTTCIDKIAGDNIDKANTVRMALWVIFKPHSALRSSLKKHSDQERQQQQQKEPA